MCGLRTESDVGQSWVLTGSGSEALRYWGDITVLACLGACPACLLTVSVPSGAEEGQRLLSVVKQLELELGHLRLQLSQHLEGGCDKMDAVMRDRVSVRNDCVSFYTEREGTLQLSSHV